MTPAVKALEAGAVPYQLLEYEAPESRDIGIAAATALGVSKAVVFKTLIAELDSGALVVAIVPVQEKLNMKRLARAARAKSAKLADPARAERATGYVTGGISPIGQKKPLQTFFASEALHLTTVYVSAGRRGLELALSPVDLARITDATVCDLTG